MFDTSTNKEVTITSGGRKTCLCRFPTDEEWCSRARKQKSVRRILGRGKSESETVDTSQADLDLLHAIRRDTDGPEFDAYEAEAVISSLERALLKEIEREGDVFSVKLSVFPKHPVTHVLRIPTAAEMREHERKSMRVIQSRNRQEWQAFLEPSGELWKKITISVDGYAPESEIPIIHKSTAIAEMLSAIAQEEDEDPEA